VAHGHRRARAEAGRPSVGATRQEADLEQSAQLPVPANEPERLAALRALRLDFSTPISEVQELCRLAADVAGAPIALVSLIDEHEQKFAANIGLDGLSGTPRAHAFCAHAIMSSGQMTVEDATLDDRFAGNPLVTGAPGIRSYAGTVLEPDAGIRLGTLCVINTRPRLFEATTLAQLRQIGGAISALLIAHRDRLRLHDALMDSLDRETLTRRAAETDALTGLSNAAHFREQSRQSLQPGAAPMALVLMDADRFKLVNDRYGHVFGDAYLRCIGDALRAAAPPGTLIGRLGGDEFGMLFRDEFAAPDRLDRALERCMAEISRAALDLDKPDLGHVSLGASLFPQHADNYEQLYLFADVALYASKENGRNRRTTYSDALGEKFNLRTLRLSFEEARRDKAIIPFYQPVIDLRSGRHVGFEILCRWNHPQRGLLTPAAFSALLTDHHSSPVITHEVLRQACRDYRSLRQMGLSPGGLAVNVTAHDLKDPDFLLGIDYYLASAGIDWSDLTIEVTETVVMGERDDQVFRSMTEARARGARVALDDFGTGYGGLQHLKSWPVDIIKIDRSFIADLGFDCRDRAIIRSIISLARELEMGIIAEGVENAGQVRILSEMGCNTAQGYLFSRPMPFASMAGFLGHDVPKPTVQSSRRGRAPGLVDR